MTTAIQIDPNDGFAQQIATAGQDEFDYDFPIYDQTHIQVLRTDAVTLAITELELTTDYTVTGVEVEAGGTIVLNPSTYPSGADEDDIYTMRLNVPEERTSDFQVAGDFFAQVLNQELDLQTQMIQQLRRDLTRAARLADDSPLDTVTLPTPIDGRAIIWDGVNGLMANSSGDIETLSSYGAILAPIAADISALAAVADDIPDVADSMASGNLAAFAALTGAADKVPYFTGASTMAVTTLTSAARGLLDDTTVAAMRTTLELDKLTVVSTNTLRVSSRSRTVVDMVNTSDSTSNMVIEGDDGAVNVYTIDGTAADSSLTYFLQGDGGIGWYNDRGTILQLAGSSNATQNYFNMFCSQTSTGLFGGPQIIAAGSGSDVNLRLRAQGDGLVLLSNNSGDPCLAVGGPIAPSAYLKATSYRSGFTTVAALSVESSTGSGNFDLGLTPYGTGVLRFGTHSSNADAAITGYISIKDAAGNARKLAVIT